MTELRADPIRVPSWALGLVQEAVPGATLPGNVSEAENFVPLPGGRMATRGGSRHLLTLKDDALNSAATPVFQAAGTAVEGTGAVSPAWPTHQTDDVALLIVETSNEAVTLSTPAGFVEVADSPQSQGAGPPFQVGIRLTVFWARATSGAMASPTVADPGDHVRAQILTFRGCITAGDPWNVTAGDGSTQTASVNIPGDTTTVDRCLVVAMVGNTTDTTTPQTSGWANGDLNNVTEIADGNTDLGFGGGFGVAVGEKALAGAYGVTTATLVSASNQARLSIALRPATVSGSAEVSHVGLIAPITPPGVLAIAFAAAVDRHFVWSLTADLAFSSGVESTSRTALPASWNNTETESAYGDRPVGAVLFEKLYVCTARTLYSARKTLLAIEGTIPPTVTEPSFDLGGGSRVLKPYTLEEHEGVLFIAGYDGRGLVADDDEPAILRHSFLGTAPDAAGGMDKDAWNIIGAKGERISALRKGRGLLLIAKRSEFWRLTGSGRALPGFQYAVEPIDNTPGMGVENPHGLTFAEGWWYGIGRQGPFRTDGFSVQSLVGPRQRAWRGINNPDRAFVTYHPERRAILFGLHPSEAAPGRSAIFPWVKWYWDIDREKWGPDQKFGADFFFVTAVATDTAEGPGAPPSAPFTTGITLTGWTANWSLGDVEAEVEYWERPAGGAWVLKEIKAAGVTSHAVTDATNHSSYDWRVRHRKGGISSAFTADQNLKTLIAAPDLTALCLGFGSVANIGITQNAPGTTLVLESSPAGAGTWTVFQTFPNSQGSQFIQPQVVSAKDFRAKSTDSAWTPTESDYSPTRTVGPCP